MTLTHGDVRTLAELPEHGILLMGFPCPGCSSLRVMFGGEMEGVANRHTAVLLQALRLVDHTAIHRPYVIIMENPRGLLAARHNGEKRVGPHAHQGPGHVTSRLHKVC